MAQASWILRHPDAFSDTEVHDASRCLMALHSKYLWHPDKMTELAFKRSSVEASVEEEHKPGLEG